MYCYLIAVYQFLLHTHNNSYIVRATSNKGTKFNMVAARLNSTHMILLVDSDQENRDFLKTEFELRNYVVLEADDDVQALEVLSYEKVDAILIDLELTKKKRREFLQNLQSEEYGSPHIVLMAAASSVTREEGYDMGAGAVLSKPVDPDMLVARVDKLIEPRSKRWRTKSDNIAQHRIAVSVEDLRFGRGGFTISSGNSRSMLEGQSVEFVLEETNKKRTIAGMGTVRYIKLDESKRIQQAWGIEIDMLDEGSLDAVLKEFGSRMPLSYIPKSASTQPLYNS